jgi:hypothetical protein
MIATDAVLRARRAAQDARRYLARYPFVGLDRPRAEQLISAAEDLVDQVNELNRIIFSLECELHYADDAAAAGDESIPDWLLEQQKRGDHA